LLVLIWEYRVRPDRVEDFASFYGPDGPWVDFFRAAPGFVSTTLWRDVDTPGRFLVADRWTSVALHDDFREREADAYRRLSERGARLYERETDLGRFDSVD
jgi:quinol monooxygenase YgiN